MRKYQFLLCIIIFIIILFATPFNGHSEINDDAQDIYRKWLQCVAEKGENNEDCNKLFQKFLTIAYKKLEDLKEEYRQKCSDPEKADSDYCKKLKKQIEELEEAIQGVTGQREKQQREKAVNSALKEDWEQVFAELSFIDLKHLQPEDNLLFGYASLHIKNWIKAWQHFSLVDKNSQKDKLLTRVEKLCKENPNSSIGYLLRGDVYARMGDYDNAINDFKKTLSLKRDLIIAYDAMGNVYALKREYDLAMVNLDKAIELELTFADAYNSRGIVNILRAKYDLANADFTHAINLKPNYALAYNGRGVSYLLEGKYDLAIEDFTKSLQINPDFSEANVNLELAYLLRAKKLFAEDLAKTMEITPAGVLKSVVLNITDFGINQWKPELKTGDDLSQAKNRVFSDISKSGQILIAMPKDSDFNRLAREQLTQQIYEKVIARVDGGLAAGTTNFEMQIVQNINTGGYVDPKRQKMVNVFGECAYKAIGMINDDLKTKGLSTNIYGFLGSNGTKVFNDTVSAWKSYKSDWRGLNEYDGRASKSSTIDMIKELGAEKVHFFNTRGDWLAPKDIPFIKDSIGNHDVLKEIKKDYFPGLLVTILDPIGRPNIVGFGHIAGMSPNSRFLAKDVIGNSYTTPRQVTGRDYLFLNQNEGYVHSALANPSMKGMIPGYYTSPDRPLAEVDIMGNMALNQGWKKIGVVGAGSDKRADMLMDKLRNSGAGIEVMPIPLGSQAMIQQTAKNLGVDGMVGLKPQAIDHKGVLINTPVVKGDTADLDSLFTRTEGRKIEATEIILKYPFLLFNVPETKP